MKTDKFYKARMDGLAYALEIVEKGGVEALKKELKVRNAYFIPMEISSKKAEELSEMLAHRILATFVPVSYTHLKNRRNGCLSLIKI